MTVDSKGRRGQSQTQKQKKAERIDQQLQDKLCQVFQSEAAILRAMRTGCCESTSLRWPGVTGRKHWHLNLRRCSSRDKWDWMSRRTTKPRQHEHCRKGKKRELLRQHRNLGHPQPTESARALRHAGTRREATRLRCPTCEARPLPLPPRPGMLPRCLRFNQRVGVDLVDLEVRDGTSAKALNVVCWGTGLRIFQAPWNGYTAHAVMSQFKAAWVKQYGRPEILVHRQGPLVF